MCYPTFFFFFLNYFLLLEKNKQTKTKPIFSLRRKEKKKKNLKSSPRTRQSFCGVKIQGRAARGREGLRECFSIRIKEVFDSFFNCFLFFVVYVGGVDCVCCCFVGERGRLDVSFGSVFGGNKR